MENQPSDYHHERLEMRLLNNRWDLFQGLFRGFFEELANPVSEPNEEQKPTANELQVGAHVAPVKNKQIKPA